MSSARKSVMHPVLIAALVLFGCGTAPNPEFCCLDEADCATFGVSEVRACGVGLACDDHRCVRARCSAAIDCPPEHPVCSEGFCVDCDEAHACVASEPVCDLSTKMCEICSSDADCGSRPEAPYCDGAGCVQCLSSAQCGAAAPFCDSGTCRACRRDAECETHACGLDGRCVPEAQIVWMAPGAGDTSTCTRADPCATFLYMESRLNGRQHVVLEPGVYKSYGGLFAPRLFIHGNGATLIHGPVNGTQATLQLSGPGMVLRDVTVSQTGPGAAALIIGAEGVLLDSVTLAGAAKRLWIFNPSSSPTAKASAVARNLEIVNSIDTVAVEIGSNGELTIEGGEISGGTVGIQGAVGAKVHLVNTLIWGTSQRALELAQAVGDIEFSTIADAGAATQAAPCAVACNPNVRVASSIIWQPSCAVRAADAAGPCTFRSSIVSNGPAPGITNVDPRFANPAARDYHLQSSSPARDATDAGPPLDLEGDPRPRGAGFDLGADEAAP